MKLYTTIVGLLIIGLLLLAVTSCQTNPKTGKIEINYDVASIELTAASQDLGELIILLEVDEPDLAETLGVVKLYIDQADAALDAFIAAGGADSTDLITAIDAFLGATDGLILEHVSEGDRLKVQAGVLAVRSILRRVKLYSAGS